MPAVVMGTQRVVDNLRLSQLLLAILATRTFPRAEDVHVADLKHDSFAKAHTRCYRNPDGASSNELR